MVRSHQIRGFYDPRAGSPVICLQGLEMQGGSFEPSRNNYFAIYRIDQGAGLFWADTTRFSFEPGMLLFFVPYQHIQLTADAPVAGEILLFHANFLCVETFHAEAGCSGVLFNDPEGIPAVKLDGPTVNEVIQLMGRIRAERQQAELGYQDAMLAYLKVLLILSTRAKLAGGAEGSEKNKAGDPRHPLLAAFRDLIERNYCRLHAPADYARLLHVTPRVLGRIVRENLGTTPSELIRNRMLTHAKWQLLHTLRPVKEIAYEVGFRDELYFSRLFRKWTGCSPTFFREFETEIRSGRNLSMLSSNASIPRKAAHLENSPRID